MLLLTSLPVDLLVGLPHYLHDIEDFKNASSTCRTLRDTLSQAQPNTILRLALTSAPVFAQPHPFFLVAATANRLSDWALQNEENTARLRQSFRGGMEGLLELCKEKSGLTMEDIRRLHLLRFSAINPTSDLIDRLAGPAWSNTENFWSGGVSDPATITCQPSRATFQIAIYGELFKSSMEATINPSKNLPSHSTETRLDFIRYCIPDWICEVGYYGMPPPERIGPYAEHHENLPPDQIALQFLLSKDRWCEKWHSVCRQIGPDFSEHWRQQLFFCAAQCQGLEGMRMLGPEGTKNWEESLQKMKEAIMRMNESNKPKTVKFGRNITWDFPNMATDVNVLMSGYWPQPIGPS